jgi:ABC-type branched-subunit amino acid transport system ATPase component
MNERPRVAAAPSPLLDVTDVVAGYGAVPVLRGLTLNVRAGEVVGLLGPNGAGKTTLIRAISGLIGVAAGTIALLGRPLSGPLHHRARRGVGMVGEERSIIRQLTVAEHFRLAKVDAADCYRHFPELERRADIRAGLLSGGEQQMLALVLALARRPTVLLADELSIGLSPMVVDRLFAVLRASAEEGIGVLVVEQQVRRTLQLTDRAYVLRRGEVVLHGEATELRDRIGDIEAAYFAVDEDESKAV